jgi:hypothetical protein
MAWKRRGCAAVGRSRGSRRGGGWNDVAWAGCFEPARSNSGVFHLFKNFLNDFELIRFKDGLPVLKIFQIKYGCELFEIRNNFSYMNFSKFRIEFELKIEEALGFELL